MNRKEKERIVTELIARKRDMETIFHILHSVVGYAENQLFESVWKTFDAYCDSVGREIGSPEVLAWFVQENNCGEKGLQAALAGKKPKVIKTVKQLIAFIES